MTQTPTDAVPRSPRTRTTRRRINGRACINCHQKKVRCDILDKGVPCTSCSTHNRSGCCLFPKKKHRESSTRPRDPVSIRPWGDVCKLPKEKAVDGARDASSKLAKRSSTSTPAPPPAENDEEHDPGNIADFINREDVRVAELSHETRLCFIGTGLSNCHYLVRESSFGSSQDAVFHYSSRQFHLKETSYRPQRIPPDALERPDKKLADKLIQAYFDHVNCGWPIIDKEWFMHQTDGRDPRNPVPLALLNAVFLVGAHVLSAQDESMRPMQHVFFHRAKALIDCRLEQDRIMYVQVALLLTWYSDGLEEVVANAWHWIGIATRTAFGIGMHQDVTQSRMQAVQKRIYTRLWWVLFQFDTIASASCGRPQVINIADSDVPELKYSDFEGIPGAAADFVMHQTKLCMIISRTMREGWALRSSPEDRAQAVKRADEALARFLTDLPTKLHLPAVNLDTWQSMLHLTYNNFVILLHRPSPRHNARDQAPEVCSDTNLCGGAADAISSIFDTLLNQGALCTLWFYCNHVLFTAGIYVGNEVGSSNPLVAAKSQRLFRSLVSSLRELSRYWRYAKSLLQLFEQRASRLQQKGTIEDKPDMATSQRPSESAPNINVESYSGVQAQPLAEEGGIGLGQDVPRGGGDGALDDLLFFDASALDFFLGETDGFDQHFGP
ncbi:fungal-specific transcription factor domain-containing protein [Thelonectria olida]|uniref:Fungal-specific transcription factor domain-containing protein n=1 Tax=Thelonectria olida TaxID=1576542 RepID=A0A9P9AMA8_9HYPO|nr:fungal-specific transcription factor domain-containing protein [Thelonectria olida]